METLLKSNQILSDVHTRYSRFTGDDYARALYEARLKQRLDENSRLGDARREGIAQGERKAKLESAKALKAMGIALDKIAEATGLSVEDIEAL